MARKLLSPFRYPGGKTWLVPQINEILSTKKHLNIFIEPFCGGAIVGLNALYSEYTDKLIIVEKDNDVASVWKAILSEEAAKLTIKIEKFTMTKRNVKNILNSKPKNIYDMAFITILRNRINRGGILAKGAGMINKGENGKGLTSRWYPVALNNRIFNIFALRYKITFLHTDGLEIIKRYSDLNDVFFFIDPPYSLGTKNAGLRLYSNSNLDHKKLFELVSNIKGDFLMTYENSPEITTMANKYGFKTKSIDMKNTHHAIVKELLITKQ